MKAVTRQVSWKTRWCPSLSPAKELQPKRDFRVFPKASSWERSLPLAAHLLR
jgi:hypothetical protein